MSETSPDTAGQLQPEQERAAYGIAFLLVLGSTLMLVALDANIGSPFAAAAGLFQVVALIVTLRVSGARARYSRIIGAAALALLATAVISVVTGGEGRTAVGVGLWLVLVLLTMAAILRRLVTFRTLTIQFVLGLLTIHILMGLSFGLAYLMHETLTQAAFAQGPQGLSGAIYFSFVTLTTLGYGDISPGSDLVRALSIAEATVGQIYLVSVVAFAVGRLGMETRAGQSGDA